ncbi:substrate-binding domain-containing protein [Pedobacter deserti]|uniref:substrate-binding domain-containing protein n=1 Tax=Pedobacter deserti TaxID=2817382 RepID=UPI00210B25E1|nr:substrate-binding domain-containing protein [Pedobacter sp. SYSU D00382]
MTIPRLCVALMMISLLVMAACKDKRRERVWTIGFSQCVGSDLWRRTMLEEMKTELSLQPNHKFLYADADNNSAAQIAQVKDMLKKGIDVLIISPNEALPLTDIVEETFKKGIPVIVIDRKTASSVYTAYIGAENFQVGKMAGGYLARLLRFKGNVLEITGLPGSSPAMERSRGLKEAFRPYPGIRVAAQVHGDWLPENTKRALQAERDKLADIDAVFAHNDRMAQSARHTLRQLGLDSAIKVIGVDALPGAGGGLDMVSSGTLTASVLYPTGGKEAIDIAFRILRKQAFQKENLLKSVVIDRSNVQLMQLQWARIRDQQKDIERQQKLMAEQKEIYRNQRFVLNLIVVTLVLAVVFGGLAFRALQTIRRQRNQLIEMSEKAAAATEAKLNFFTNISHEFRTPLTLIISPLEDLQKNTKVATAAGRELNLIHKNVHRLLRLVNQLMDYRKIEHKELKLHATPNSLTAFVGEIVDHFRHIAAKRHIDLRLLVKADPNTVWFDTDMLDKVLFNLLSNAFKFTADHGRIYVSVDRNDREAVVEVSDNGLGMDEEEQGKIFNRFYQSDARRGGGSGLGLSLSKELMALHKGAIKVASKKGEGTVFSVHLPLGEAHLSETERKPSAGRQLAPYHEAPEEAPSPISLVKEQSLLIVEDNLELLEYLTSKFENDYQVFTANSGTDGLHIAFEQIPDLIISDVVIPGISGRELTKQLKADVRTSHIPVILLTAQDSVEQQISGIQSNADAYLTKPFHFDYLRASVENLLRNRAVLKAHYISDLPLSGNQKAPVSNIDKKFLNDFARLVEQNLANEQLSVDELAKAVGVSRVQLYRKVKALLNCTVTDYVMNRRLKKAKYYLANEHHSVSEISYLVGISSPTYFSTLFKNRYGMTPTAYKKTVFGNKL